MGPEERRVAAINKLREGNASAEGDASVKSAEPAIPPAGSGKLYKVPEETVKMILDATVPSDVDLPTRCKLYSAINRMMERPYVNPKIVARWSADSHSNAKKFQFLKEWVQDTSCAEMLVKEKHTRTHSSFEDNTHCWATKCEIHNKLGAFHCEEAKEFADEQYHLPV